MSEMKLQITGMTCGHCVAAVTKALQSVPGVESAEVSLEQKQGIVKGNADPKVLIEAVKKAGYNAQAAA
ncbi:MAG TPA: cation transporter [Acidiferrobacter sp.]|nr:cation transporter [Acidiferrobacter sp.]